MKRSLSFAIDKLKSRVDDEKFWVKEFKKDFKEAKNPSDKRAYGLMYRKHMSSLAAYEDALKIIEGAL